MKKIINLDFPTLSSSIFDFNQVVIFDISVLLLFLKFMFFLRLPKVSSVDISVVSSAYMIKSNTELAFTISLIKILKRSDPITDPCGIPIYSGHLLFIHRFSNASNKYIFLCMLVTPIYIVLKIHSTDNTDILAAYTEQITY